MTAIKRYILALLLLVVASSGIFAQNPPECDVILDNLEFVFEIPAVIDPCEQFPVRVSVNGFEQVAAFQFTLSFDPTKFELLSFDDSGPLAPIEPNLAGEEQGNIGFLWFDLNGTGVTIADDTQISNLFFKAVGEPGDISPLTFTSNVVFYQFFITLQDGTECIFEDGVNITLSSPFEIGCSELFVSSSACGTNGSDGVLEFSFCGGTPPYSWDVEGIYTGGAVATGTVNSDFEVVTLDGLSPDSYFINVVDAAGNIPLGFLDPVEIAASDPILVDAIVSREAPCHNLPGDISVNFSGGNDDNYFIEWSNLQFGVDEITVPQGAYSVTVTDGSGCTASSEVSFSTPELMATVTMLSNASCPGSMDGVARIEVTGGTPINLDEYDFENTVSTFWERTDLNSGDFSVTVKDANNCSIEVEFTVGLDADPGFSFVTITPAECFGVPGTYQIETDVADIVDSAAPIFITDADGDFLPSASFPGSGIIDFFGDPEPGPYNVVYTTVGGCQVTGQFDIPNFPPAIVLSVLDSTLVSCAGNDGSINIDASGGTGTLTATWSNSEMGTSITGLGTGEYTVTVSDGNMCSDSLTVNLGGDGGSLNIMAMVTQTVGCGAQAMIGEVNVDIVTTSTNLDIEWTDNTGAVVGDTETVMGLGAGEYTVEVTDLDGDCSNTASVTIEGAGNFTFNSDVDNPACAGSLDGEININQLVGITTPSFEWSHDATLTFGTAINLDEGSYTVTITDDDNGCQLDSTFILSNIDTIEIDVTSITGTLCFGGDGGTAIATASGSPFGSTQYNYFWSDMGSNSTGPSSTANNLVSGNQFVYAVDNACVSDTFFFDVPSPDSLSIDTLNSTINDPTCVTDANGIISLQIEGGTVAGDYQYAWASGESSSEISNLSAGSYEVTVMDDNNCEAIFDFTLVQPDTLKLELDNNLTSNIGCNSTTGATIAVIASGGTGMGYSYSWTPNVTMDSIATSLAPGMYSVTVTDSGGCTEFLDYEVTGVTPVVAEAILLTPIPCNSGSTQLCIQNVSGGTGTGYTYQINGNDNIPIDSCATVFAQNYTITVADSDGCPLESPLMVEVTQPDPITVELGDDITLNVGDTLTLSSTVIATNPISSYIWTSSAESFDCVGVGCEEIIISNTNPAGYELTVTDLNGCTGMDDIFVEVKSIRNVFIPNVFDPNFLGENFFPFVGQGVETIDNFVIYDRWGNLMYEEADIAALNAPGLGWDATFNGSRVVPGVYVYFAAISFSDGEQVEYKGSVTVID